LYFSAFVAMSQACRIIFPDPAGEPLKVSRSMSAAELSNIFHDRVEVAQHGFGIKATWLQPV
jgi:hypothetical protein